MIITLKFNCFVEVMMLHSFKLVFHLKNFLNFMATLFDWTLSVQTDFDGLNDQDQDEDDKYI